MPVSLLCTLFFLFSVCLGADVAQINVVKPPLIGANPIAIESETPQPQFVPLIRGEPKVGQPNPEPDEPKPRVPRVRNDTKTEDKDKKDKVVSVVKIEPQAQLAIPSIEKRNVEERAALDIGPNHEPHSPLSRVKRFSPLGGNSSP